MLILLYLTACVFPFSSLLLSCTVETDLLKHSLQLPLKQIEERDKLSIEGTGEIKKTYGSTEGDIPENGDIVEGLG